MLKQFVPPELLGQQLLIPLAFYFFAIVLIGVYIALIT